MANLPEVKSKKRVEQINLIVKYAKEILGVDVKFLAVDKMENKSGGYLAPNGLRRAELMIGNYHSGLQTIFILIHELGHHIDFLQRGYVHEEEVAYHYYPEEKRCPCPKKWHKHILNTEYQAIVHSREIVTYLGLKLPIFSYLKDEVYNIISVKYILENGITNREDRRYLWSKSSDIAKKALINNKNKLPPTNHLIDYF